MLPGTCEFCGDQLHTYALATRVKEALRWNQVPVCGYCLMDCCAPFPGNPPRRFLGRPQQPLVSTRADLIALIRSLASDTGVIPQTDLVKFMAQVPLDRIMVTLRHLWQLPNAGQRSSLVPEGWLTLLAEAGALEMESAGGIGTRCRAEDGHPCRSLGEKFLDDWLYCHAIPHQREPEYPHDPDLNPNRNRADFQVSDVWIEYFGLMNRADYVNKVGVKRRLAEKHNIHLVEIYPEDLNEACLREKLGFLVV